LLLKLWKWDVERSTYALNTRIDKPHGKDQVDIALFSPLGSDGKCTLVTGGRDGNVKVWKIKTVGSSKKGSLEGMLTRSLNRP
jgi:NET1-associated nuclear protein 1 (U3 small nucleolar RNA-associated protein 17)